MSQPPFNIPLEKSVKDESKESKCPYAPPFPTPLEKGDKRSLWQLYKRIKKSWIHTMYAGSFQPGFGSMRLPSMRLFMPRKPELVAEVLGKEYKNYPKHQLMHEALKPLLGESIFTTNGELWEKQRRLVMPAFANAGMKKVFPLMQEAASEMQQRLEKIPENTPYAIDAEMTHVTADIIMRTILSVSISDTQTGEFFKQFEEFQERTTQISALLIFKLPRWIFPYNYYLWKKRGKQIRTVVGKIIEKRYKEFQEKQQTKQKTNYGDILEALMQSTDKVTKEKFTEKELVDQVVMLFLAGHETSASALSWCCYILSNQSHYAEQLRKESLKIIPNWSEMRHSDMTKLQFTQAVFNETLRLYPPVPFFVRNVAKSTTLGNKTLEKNAAISVSPWLIHRQEGLWENPHNFQPERFYQQAKQENEKNEKQCPGAYFPFSMGSRICVGKKFAEQEALLLLTTLTRHFEFLPVKEKVPEAAGRLTLRSLNGIYIKIKKRSSP